MSSFEQFLFAALAVLMLTGSLALSDPGLGLAAALKREGAGHHYVLQSCSR
jgi:hypothetical protein